MTIDFGEIKGYFKRTWDHKLILPKEINGVPIEGIRKLMDAFDLMGVDFVNMSVTKLYLVID